MQHVQTSEPSAPIDLKEAARIAGYAPEYLRTLMWSDDPPPLRKHRGRWTSNADAMREWVQRRDARMSGEAG